MSLPHPSSLSPLHDGMDPWRLHADDMDLHGEYRAWRAAPAVLQQPDWLFFFCRRWQKVIDSCSPCKAALIIYVQDAHLLIYIYIFLKYSILGRRWMLMVACGVRVRSLRSILQAAASY